MHAYFLHRVWTLFLQRSTLWKGLLEWGKPPRNIAHQKFESLQTNGKLWSILIVATIAVFPLTSKILLLTTVKFNIFLEPIIDLPAAWTILKACNKWATLACFDLLHEKCSSFMNVHVIPTTFNNTIRTACTQYWRYIGSILI